ncbi:Uncharacterised protein [Mycobacteroides abscessus subsp. bolletii]|nr:Uncharacterised protein [Mycobacteroides abscessus subsp. bolletii]
MPRVLVFVQQHHSVALSLSLSDDGMVGGQPRRQRHLCTEIENTPGTHQRNQLLHDRHQLRSLTLCFDQTQQPGARPTLTLARTGRQREDQPFELIVR